MDDSLVGPVADSLVGPVAGSVAGSVVGPVAGVVGAKSGWGMVPWKVVLEG